MICPKLSELPRPSPERKGWPWTEETRPLAPLGPDDAAWPKVSIVTPSFNQAVSLEETIRSVLLQGYPNLEYIIIDGASTDNSVDVIKKYEPWISYWVSEKDQSATHAVAKGFALATGELFGIMPADDIFSSEGIISLVQLRNANPLSVAWVGGCPEIDSSVRVVNVGKPYIHVSSLIGDWWEEAWFGGPACLFSSQAYFSVGGIDVRFRNASDVELWVRLSKIGSFVLTDKTVAVARFNPFSLSHLDRETEMTALISLNYVNGHYENARKILQRYAKNHGLQNASPSDVCDCFLVTDLIQSMRRRDLILAVMNRIKCALRRRIIKPLRLLSCAH